MSPKWVRAGHDSSKSHRTNNSSSKTHSGIRLHAKSYIKQILSGRTIAPDLGNTTGNSKKQTRFPFSYKYRFIKHCFFSTLKSSRSVKYFFWNHFGSLFSPFWLRSSVLSGSHFGSIFEVRFSYILGGIFAPSWLRFSITNWSRRPSCAKRSTFHF